MDHQKTTTTGSRSLKASLRKQITFIKHQFLVRRSFIKIIRKSMMVLLNIFLRKSLIILLIATLRRSTVVLKHNKKVLNKILKNGWNIFENINQNPRLFVSKCLKIIQKRNRRLSKGWFIKHQFFCQEVLLVWTSFSKILSQFNTSDQGVF